MVTIPVAVECAWLGSRDLGELPSQD